MSANRLNRLAARLELVTEHTGKAASWLALILVLTTGLIVILRHVFQTGSIALQESLIYINALLFTLGAGYTLKHQGHVRVDIFYNRYSPSTKSLIDLCGALVLLVPFSIFVLWTSWDYVSLSWQIRERSAETSGLPLVYLLKTTILILAAALLWQGVAELIKDIERFRQSNQQ